MTDYSPKALAKRFPVKYAQDCLQQRTIAEVAEEYILLRDSGCTPEESMDYIDQEFLFGAWGGYSQELPNNFLRGIRGFIHHVYNMTRQVQDSQPA